MKARRGLLLLLSLALLFAASKFLPRGGGGSTVRKDGSAALLGEEEGASSRGRKGKGSVRTVDPPILTLDRLDVAPSGESFAIGRNLFRYGAPKAPQPPPGAPGGQRPGSGRPGEAPQGSLAGVPLTPPQPPVPAAPPKPQPPPVTVRYLGAFGPPGRLVAVFTDGDEIFDVFEGETFAARYILRRINLETVELGFVGFADDQIEKLEVGP